MRIQKDLKHVMDSFYKQYETDIFKDTDLYGEWLAQTYYFVRHSTALLGHALPHLNDDLLRRHFEHHLSEEERHDLLALKDLEKLGKKIEEFEEYNVTQAFYHSQYYRITFEHGTSLLGYILFLEGLAVHWAKDCYETVKNLHKGSVLFLKVHAEEDPHHLQEAIDLVMRLTPTEQESILRNLHYTHEIYGYIMQKAIEASRAKKKLHPPKVA